MSYVQRYPSMPKAIWWKRYTGTASLGKRTIYLATPSLGFEVEGYPQGFVPRPLFNGQLNTEDEVEYITITETLNGELVTSKALKLNDRFYMFNPETNSMEEHDLIEEGIEIVAVDAVDIIRLEKNVYLKKFAFDCIQIGTTENNNSNPISSMLIDEQTRVFKTHVFQDESPGKALQHDDLIVYENKLFIIQYVQWKYYYTPKKQRCMEFSVTKVR